MTPEEKNELNAQIAEWEKITREKDGDDAYIEAQFNLGVFYQNQLNDFEKATEYYKEVDKSYSQLYAKSQLALAVIEMLSQGQSDKDIQSNIDNFKKIIEDGSLDGCYDTYLNAIVMLANIYIQQKYDYVLAKELLESVIYDEKIKLHPELYSYLSFMLGNVYFIYDKNIDKALLFWNNVSQESDKNIYNDMLFNKVLALCVKHNYSEAKNVINSISDNKKHPIHLYSKILNMKNFDADFFPAINNLYNTINEIGKNLFFVFDEFERKFAHYTSIGVSRILLDKEMQKNCNASGLLRLNNIYNMNDPTEGNILLEYLNPKLCHNDEYGNMQYSPFIACFTLNHDSLNQFRLYGKSDQKEATGLSLVFDQGFFNLYFNNFSYVNIVKEDSVNLLEQKLGIFRCVYIDPETGYTHIAQRDKMTFYREFCQNKSKESIENLWENYQKNIQKKEKVVNDNLKIIKKIIENILSMISKEQEQEYLDLISLILLPLQYLVKHSAFQEEQECRMCYITSLSDPCIKMDFDKKWLYIDYPEPVKPHIKNVYIATGAKEYYPFIVRLLGENSASKVQLSKNPFRTTG